ncbi:MAG: hypothetical protein ACRENU_03495 [Gemmatimonadaceae bacterium]
MRFLLLPFAALAFTSPRLPEPAPTPVVILVHGRGLLDADSAELHREWKRDLDTALVGVGLPALADRDFRLAWYADAFDPVSPGRCSARSSEDSLGLGSFVQGFLGTLAASMPREDSPGARALLADVLYVIDPQTRCAAEGRVASVIDAALAEKRPVVLVAYSLGSLVTYGYLTTHRGRDTDADVRLVTLGSPLGNSDLRALLGGDDSLRVPSIVRTWDNVYDANDLFAAPLGSSSSIVRDRVARPGSSFDPHHIGRYLRDVETGTAVGRALCATAPTLADACRRLTNGEKG